MKDLMARLIMFQRLGCASEEEFLHKRAEEE